MFNKQVIDFTRHDLWWLLWVVVPIVSIGMLDRQSLKDSKNLLKILWRRVVAGLIIATLMMGLLELWKAWGPQYFHQMHIEQDRLRLKFSPLTAEVIVPMQNVKSISVVDGPGCRRVRLKTWQEVFQSLGFYNLDADQTAILESLRQRIATNSASGLGY